MMLCLTGRVVLGGKNDGSICEIEIQRDEGDKWDETVELQGR